MSVRPAVKRRSTDRTAPLRPDEQHRHVPTRQKKAGEAIRQRSRERLVQGAAAVFAELGYAGTTVNAIADRAGVSLGTLYTAWGSKRALLRAYVEHTMTGSPTGITDGTWVPQLQTSLDPQSLADPQARMRHLALTFRRICERMALAWRLVRDGAAVDAGVADDQAELEHLRRGTMAGMLDGLGPDDLRPELDLDTAVDTLLVIASPATYTTLVSDRGYTLDQFELWLASTLTAALLRPHQPPTASTAATTFTATTSTAATASTTRGRRRSPK